MGASILKKLIIFTAFALLAVSPVLDADAASKKPGNRSDYTQAQQKKFYDEALKACRKRFGAQLHFVRMDYKKRRSVCYYY